MLVEIKEIYVTRFMSRFIFVSYASRLFFKAVTPCKTRNWNFAKAIFPLIARSSLFSLLRRRLRPGGVMPPRIKKPLRISERYADLCISAGEGKKYYKASKYIFFRGGYIAPWRGITEPKLTMRPLRELHIKEEERKGTRKLNRRRRRWRRRSVV